MPKRRYSAPKPDDSQGFFLVLFVLIVIGQFLKLDWHWQVVVLGVPLIWFIAFKIWASRHRKNYEQAHLLNKELHGLTSTQFEHRVFSLLEYLIWKDLKHRGGSRDKGVDIEGWHNGKHWIVQCKRFKDLVGPNIVRELSGTLNHEQADMALLVTTGRVSADTRKWSKGKHIDIWDGEKLGRLVAQQVLHQTHPSQLRAKRRQTPLLLTLATTLTCTIIVWAVIAQGGDIHFTKYPAAAAEVSTAAIEKPQPTAQPTPTTCGEASIQGVPGLALRTAPSLQAAMIEAYPATTVVVLTCEPPIQADGILWRQVRIESAQGWMSSNYLK